MREKYSAFVNSSHILFSDYIWVLENTDICSGMHANFMWLPSAVSHYFLVMPFSLGLWI